MRGCSQNTGGIILAVNCQTADAVVQALDRDSRATPSPGDEHLREIMKILDWTKRTMSVRRVLMLVACLASGILIAFFAHSTTLAIVCALFVACLFDEIPVAWLMSIGVAFLCAAGVLAIVEYAGWVNDSPGMTILAANLGIVDLHDAGNRAALICLEAFTLGTIAHTLQLARRRSRRRQ